MSPTRQKYGVTDVSLSCLFILFGAFMILITMMMKSVLLLLLL